ncbi:MAG: efflux RND transporter permease subunit, partial [Rhodospirillales bacterium]
AQVVADTVAAPIEQQVVGVEHTLYMSSQSNNDGSYTLDVTFKLGTDVNMAQVLVQNRVAIAEPRLPEEVRSTGVTVAKQSPDMLMVIHLSSSDGSRDTLYISNYATLNVKDVLARIDGVGNVTIFGARDYSMRIWLDPEKLAARNLTGGDVVAALRASNVQVASGAIGQAPVPAPGAFELSVETKGRLTEVEQFERIVVKSDSGRVTRLSDVARVELGARDYTSNGYLDERIAVPMGIFQRPGSNALATATALKKTMAELSKSFPPGLRYDIIYNPTEFISESVKEVIVTIFEAALLVIVVVILFLQTWRASIIPIVAIPVSLIGTFAVLAAFGFSLNNLSLFGLVLAIGIVVDDAIVVVENVERNLRAGMSPREAAHKTMDEVGGALVAIALVLSAVFVPAAFLPGIPGQFFRQFAVTIAASTVISLLVSLTLSPALCALLFKPHAAHAGDGNILTRLLHAFFAWFNRGFDWVAGNYGNLVRRLIRTTVIMLIAYGGLVGLTGWQFARAPTGFIPAQDLGYLINVIQLPPGSSLARTDAVAREATKIILKTPGVAHAVPIVGLDGSTFTNAPNSAVVFSTLEPFRERARKGLQGPQVQALLNQRLSAIQDAFIISVVPPPVRGIGNAGGFKMMVQDRRGRGLDALEAAANDLVAAANQTPGMGRVFTLFNTRTPKIYADLDPVRGEILGVSEDKLTEVLAVYLGSVYVNDFNILGRTYRVTAQADGKFRQDIDTISNLKARNKKGEMVPIGSVASFKDITGPYRTPRYNLYPAAELIGAPLPGYSSSYGLQVMEKLAAERLPEGLGFEWTELAFQEKQAGDTALIVFGAAVIFVFLLLAAQYESWSLPLAVILIVPMCLFAAIVGLTMRTM